MSLDLESIVLTTSTLGVFGLMISNGLIAFPSSQVLYILCGYFIATGKLSLIPIVIAGAIGNTIGNVLLFEIVRRKGPEYLLRWNVFRSVDFKKIEAVFRKRGIWFLFVGKLLPAIKVFVPIPAGLGNMNRNIFSLIMLVASSIWALGFIAIGYFFGRSSTVFGTYAVVLTIVAVLVVSLFYRYLESDEIKHEIAIAGDGGEAAKK